MKEAHLGRAFTFKVCKLLYYYTAVSTRPWIIPALSISAIVSADSCNYNRIKWSTRFNSAGKSSNREWRRFRWICFEIYVVSTSLSAAMFRLVILIKTRPPGDERAHTRPLARWPLGILAAWRPCGAVFLHSADHGCGVSLYSGNVRHYSGLAERWQARTTRTTV